MTSTGLPTLVQGAHDHDSNAINDVNLSELLQTLSNEQVLRLIPRSAIDSLHHVSNQIRNGVFNAQDTFASEAPMSPLAQSPPSLTHSPPPVSPKKRQHGVSTSLRPSTSEARKESPAKRPLNGFIAFRAYYQRIFTQVPQKSISSLITQLWKNDPFQTRWMLIGRVYSFIRDTIGKSNVKLSDFLEVAVPIMGAPVPQEYFAKFCWVYCGNHAGDVSFFQDIAGLQRYLSEVSHVQIPNTEQDLLNLCLVNNYLPAHSEALLTKLANNYTSLITMHGRPSKRARNKPVYEQPVIAPMNSPEQVQGTEQMGSFTINNPSKIYIPPFDLPLMPPPEVNFWPSPEDMSFLHETYLSTPYDPQCDIFNMPIHSMYDVMQGFDANGSGI